MVFAAKAAEITRFATALMIAQSLMFDRESQTELRFLSASRRQHDVTFRVCRRLRCGSIQKGKNVITSGSHGCMLKAGITAAITTAVPFVADIRVAISTRQMLATTIAVDTI